jgi:ABC-type branched-subunit amino acid transport system substrate-binding protein
MTSGRGTGLRVAVALAWLLGTSWLQCHTFESLENCTSNKDCRLDQKCHVEGKFCEKDTGDLVFGALLPLEGAAAPVGEDFKKALRLAEHVVNDGGGVLGRKIRFQELQDRPTEVAQANARRLIDEDRVLGILGGTNSGVSLTLQEIAAPLHVLVISPSATSPVLSTNEKAHDRYFFRTTGVTRRGEALAQGLFTRSGDTPLCQSTVMIDDDSTFAQGYRDAYAEVFAKLGGCIVGRAVVPGDTVSSYAAQIAVIQDKKPDCALLVTLEATLEVYRQAKDTLTKDGTFDPAKLVWLSASPAHGQDFIDLGADPKSPGTHIAEGILISDADSNPPTNDYLAFRKLYNAFYGVSPADTDTPPGVTNVFDAAVLFALAVERAGSVVDRVAIRDGLWSVVGRGPDHAVYGPDAIPEILRLLRLRRELSGNCGKGPGSAPCEVRYRGASSQLLFDDLGAVAVPSAIYRLHDNAFEVVKRYDERDYDAFDLRSPTPGQCPL